MELKRVVVTGLGAITPIGNNLEEFWNGLVNGISGSDLITHFDTEKFKTKFACEVKNFNPADFFENWILMRSLPLWHLMRQLRTVDWILKQLIPMKSE